ncbi:MAG: Crp/Fnr family transcriptional regulator [Cyanobacteria bacterium J06639_1]
MPDVSSIPEPLLAIAKPQPLTAGDILFRPGDRVRDIFAVETGRLRLMRYGADGRELTLFVARAGDILTEAALFAQTYHCYAIAEVASQAIAIPKVQLLNYLQSHPAQMMAWLERVTQTVQQLRTRLELRNIPTARDRLWHFLTLSVPVGERECTFDRPWKAIASELGLTHDALYRALAALERQGFIQRRGRWVRWLDYDRDRR